MKKFNLKTAIFQSLMSMGEEQYPIGKGLTIRFKDFNEWGDENVENYGVQLLKEGVELGNYRLGNYTGGTVGNLIFYGWPCVTNMIKDISKDAFGTREEEVVLNYLPF